MFLSLIYIKGQFVEAFVGQVGLLYKKTNGFRYLETGSAEREGFEPSVPVKAQRFSRPPRSTTPAPLQASSIILFPADMQFISTSLPA